MIYPFSFEDNTFRILDQRALPEEEKWIECTEASQVAEAIRTLAVRGAPAIGIAAAFGCALAARSGRAELEKVSKVLIEARPTAINLSWAVNRVKEAMKDYPDDFLLEAALREAFDIWDEEKLANESMAKLGAELFPEGKSCSVLTHCNAGSLATGGIGTALGIIKLLHIQNKLSRVYMDETRPLLQGARITAYEMTKADIPATLVTDSMAGWLMKLGRIDAVIVGADRIARNFDTANKIGTYSLAVLARAHGIPFYVAAPTSTFDPDTVTGGKIPIEERDAGEVRAFHGQVCAPEVDVFNPSFDVTDHSLISAIITEREIHYPSAEKRRHKEAT
jgi:methylthioribose-1-phosphate isomerase